MNEVDPVRHYGDGVEMLPTSCSPRVIYGCARCGSRVAASVIANTVGPGGGVLQAWLRCPACGLPASRDEDGIVSPAQLLGEAVDGLPVSLASAYEEARLCLTGGAHSACEIVCRRILMQVAIGGALTRIGRSRTMSTIWSPVAC